MAEEKLRGPRIYWGYFISLLLAYNLVAIPFRIAFEWWSPWLQSVDLAADLFFLLDLYFAHSVTTLSDSNRGLRRWYFVRRWFPLEIIALLPLDWIFFSASPLTVALLRGLRLLRYIPYIQYKQQESQNRYITGVRDQILKITGGIALIAHVLGCAWFFVGMHEIGNPQAWVTRVGIASEDILTQYLKSIYWAIVTITTVGYGDVTPSTDLEIFFCIVAMLIGASYWAYALATITSIISGTNRTANAFRDSLDRVSNYLRYRQVPTELNQRVLAYYESIWRRHKTLDVSSILGDLPTPLRVEISRILHRELVSKVPFFQSLGPGFINSIVAMLKPQVCSPGDTLIQKGELGKEMYFLSSGSVEVLNHDETTVVHTYGPGDFFGELSLLSSTTRTATLKATAFCDIFVLSKENFDEVLQNYPEFAEEIQKIADERLKRTHRQMAADHLSS